MHLAGGNIVAKCGRKYWTRQVRRLPWFRSGPELTISVYLLSALSRFAVRTTTTHATAGSAPSRVRVRLRAGCSEHFRSGEVGTFRTFRTFRVRNKRPRGPERSERSERSGCSVFPLRNKRPRGPERSERSGLFGTAQCSGPS